MSEVIQSVLIIVGILITMFGLSNLKMYSHPDYMPKIERVIPLIGFILIILGTLWRVFS